MSVAKLLQTHITEGQMIKHQDSQWQVIAIAIDQSKVVIEHTGNGKVKMVCDWEVS